MKKLNLESTPRYQYNWYIIDLCNLIHIPYIIGVFGLLMFHHNDSQKIGAPEMLDLKPISYCNTCLCLKVPLQSHSGIR